MAKKERRIEVPGNPSRVKGKLVEAIVAAMHDAPNVVVRTNVRLRPLLGGRGREIDILIDGSMIGYPWRLAIECKNERQPVGAPEMDAFVGKLQYLGIPPQQGIFVSVTGFTKGASEHARAVGVRTLVLVGLTEDRLRAVLFDAIQAIVHLLPVVTGFTIVNDIDGAKEPWQMSQFFDDTGELAGTVPDLLWRAWYEREVPDTLGEHHLNLRVPKGWRHVVNGKESPPGLLTATVRLDGLTIMIKGVAERYDLINSASGVRERTRIEARFGQDEDALHLGTFATADELNAALRTHASLVRVTTRVRLPRLHLGGILWPPSEAAWRKLAEAIEPGSSDVTLSPSRIDIAALEPFSFASLFEPVWLSNPLRKVLRAEFDS